MNDSEDLQNVVFHDFTHEKFRKSSDDIKNEESSEVVVTDLWQFFVGSGSFNKVEDNLNEVNDINSQFNFLKSSVINVFSIFTAAWIGAFADKINTLECKNEWRYEEGVDGEHCDDEVPYFAESSLGIN